jgi:hypothetical protein
MAAKVCSTSHSTQPEVTGRSNLDAVPRHRLRYAFASVATLALASVAPCVAKAQASGASTGAAGAFGPSAAGSRPLTIGVQERTTYDSDAARSSGAAAAIRGLDGADVIYAPSITVDYNSYVGRQGVALTGYFGYDYYQKNTQLRREHIDLAASINKPLGRCLVGGRVAYDRGQSSLEDLVLTVTKNTLQTYTVGVNETCATTSGITESLQVQYSGATNSAATLVDYNTTGVSGSVGYGNRTLGNIALVANYTSTGYQNTTTTPSFGTPNSLQAVSVGVQVSRPIGNRLAGEAALFYTSSKSDLGPTSTVGRNTSFSGLTANAGLTYKIGPRLVLHGSYARDVQASIRQDVGYSINNMANLTADYTVSSRIHMNLGGSWSREDFRGQNPLVPEIAPNRVDLKTIYAGVSVKVGRNASVSGDVHHEESRTDLALFNFTSDRVSLTLATSF